MYLFKKDNLFYPIKELEIDIRKGKNCTLHTNIIEKYKKAESGFVVLDNDDYYTLYEIIITKNEMGYILEVDTENNGYYEKI